MFKEFLLIAISVATPVPQVQLRISAEDKPAFTRDDAATRALTGVQLVANNGLCMDVTNITNGDFRENKVPILLAPCQANTPAGQKWDLITSGVHIINDPKKPRTLLVSQVNQHCVDSNTVGAFDNIKPALFACGGRAAGDGKESGTQTIFFNANNAKVGGKIAFPFTNNAQGNTAGPGNTCLTVLADGKRVGLGACDGSNPAPNQLFTIQNGAGSNTAQSAGSANVANNGNTAQTNAGNQRIQSQIAQIEALLAQIKSELQ
ncbi:hypothetical protein HDV04_005869 [Boothiomyces sp. JEL0838]|nr:hypothetical protein HDV04_005869 [Boothiomyces sp. JEL0838]